MYYPKSSFRRSYNLEKKSTQSKKTKGHAKILLPPAWSGLVTVGESSQPRVRQQSNFSTSLWNVCTESNFRGVIFRNVNPIGEIRPYKPCGTNKDAINSLKSLDNRLQREFQSSFLPDTSEEADEQDLAGTTLQVDASRDGINRPKKPENWREKTETRNIVREFDVTKISPRPNMPTEESPMTHRKFLRQSSVSTMSSFKLNLDELDSTQTNFLRPTFHSRTPSEYSDRFDVQSLASSTGSLMFTSYNSRKEAYNAIKSPRYDEQQITAVSKLVRQLSDIEGRERNQRFGEDFCKLCDVVNALIQKIPAIIMPFRIKHVEKDCHYETVGSFAFDFYLVADVPYGDFEVKFRDDHHNIADIFLTADNPTLELFSVSDADRRKLSPCKLMAIFTQILKATTRDCDMSETRFPHNAIINYERMTEKDGYILVTLPGKENAIRVNFVLTFDILEFPGDTALRKTRQWPSEAIKQSVQRQGVHLTSKVNELDLHAWTVTFLKSRRALLQLTDETGNKLRLLLALQCLRETRLANPDVILPAHFATILFWASIKYMTPTEWTTPKIGKRFIDLIVALRRCLWKRECLDFFVPNVNMFKKLKLEDCRALSIKIDMLIKDPVSYLKTKIA